MNAISEEPITIGDCTLHPGGDILPASGCYHDDGLPESFGEALTVMFPSGRIPGIGSATTPSVAPSVSFADFIGKRGYISGPMRGYPNENFDAFNRLALRLRREGYEVLNPAEHFGGAHSNHFDSTSGLPVSAFFREDVNDVLHADFLIMLPGWTNSTGSLIEVAMARMLGLPIFSSWDRHLIDFGGSMAANDGALDVTGHYSHKGDMTRLDAIAAPRATTEEFRALVDSHAQASYDNGYRHGYNVAQSESQARISELESERQATTAIVDVQTRMLREARQRDLDALVQTGGPSEENIRAMVQRVKDCVFGIKYQNHDDELYDRHVRFDDEASDFLLQFDEHSDETPSRESVIDFLTRAHQLLSDLPADYLSYGNADAASVEHQSLENELPGFISALSGEASGGTVERSILAEADDLINGDRQAQYGHPGNDFRDIAAFWSTYLGTTVQAHDVWAMMVLLKLSRHKNGYKRDTLVDIAGYAGTGEKIQQWVEDGFLPPYEPHRQAV